MSVAVRLSSWPVRLKLKCGTWDMWDLVFSASSTYSQGKLYPTNSAEILFNVHSTVGQQNCTITYIETS